MGYSFNLIFELIINSIFQFEINNLIAKYTNIYILYILNFLWPFVTLSPFFKFGLVAPEKNVMAPVEKNELEDKRCYFFNQMKK